MAYRSWFSSWVRSVFKAFAGGMVRWGGILIWIAVSYAVKRIRRWSLSMGKQLRLCAGEREESGESRILRGGYEFEGSD